MASENRVTVNITPEFNEWLDAYVKSHGFKSRAEALISLAEAAAQDAGFDGELMKGRGKYDRELAGLMKDADLVTDFGRNDPAESDLWNDPEE